MNVRIGMRSARSSAALLALSLVATAAIAEEVTGLPEESIATSLNGGFDKDARAALAAKGITYGINYIGETFSNTGGAKQGTTYEGRLELLVDADLEKLWGLKGLTFHGNGYQIHGVGQAENLGGPIMLTSSIEAHPNTRLFELWLDQKFGENVSIRAGQLAVDSEFFTTKTGGNFINSTFGWAGIWAADLPNGGNGYPLATPGARVQLNFSDALTFRAAIYNGNPAGCVDDYGGQVCDPFGTNFPVNDPPFLIQELEYKYNQAEKKGGAKDGGMKDSAPAATGFWNLPGVIKIGAWQNLLDFENIYTATLAENGVPVLPRVFDNNYGFYAMIDQQIYALASDPKKGVNVFARIAGAPSDARDDGRLQASGEPWTRNLVSFYADGGVVFSGFVPSRDEDTFGVAAAYAQISENARDADRTIRYNYDSTYRVRDYESVLEVFYKAQIVPGFSVQPDFQYMWNPGGGRAGVDNAFLAGLRFTVAY